MIELFKDFMRRWYMILGLIALDCLTYKEKECEILDSIEELSKSGELKCPACGNKVKIHGTYRRNVIFSDNKTVSFKIFQIRCTDESCRKVHAIIPDFIFPRKQYCAAIIKNAMFNGKYDACPADDSTIRRWITGQANNKPNGNNHNEED